MMRYFAWAFSAVVLASVPAAADPVADFYKGKQMRMIIRSGVGGGYDLYARVLAAHIGKHIPGNPTIIPVNMPGGGGIKAANYVANVAPKDGTILTIVSQGLAVDQALELNNTLEADLTNPWVSYKATTPHLIEKKQIIPIMQVGMQKEPDLQDVPLLRDLAKNAEQKQILDFISASVAIGRPIATTPGVPAERVAALRKAFDATLNDPEFIADTEKQRMEIRAMTGAELATLVKNIIEAPADIRAKVKTAIEPKDTVKAPKKGGG
jgi:tripartite-type tricarboxylate transporter receptor subunit TctC